MSDSSDTTGSDYLESDYGDEDVHEDNVEEWTDLKMIMKRMRIASIRRRLISSPR